MAYPSNITQELEQHGINFIRNNWGSLRDLPEPLIPIIWVTVHRGVLLTKLVEDKGGPAGLLKNILRGNHQINADFENAIQEIQLLKAIIPVIRSNSSRTAKNADSQLLIDILKWGITDAASMSDLRRFLHRLFAKADRMYEAPIPSDLFF